MCSIIMYLHLSLYQINVNSKNKCYYTFFIAIVVILLGKCMQSKYITNIIFAVNVYDYNVY